MKNPAKIHHETGQKAVAPALPSGTGARATQAAPPSPYAQSWVISCGASK